MKIATLAALLAALSLPIAASAQVVQPAPLQTQAQHNPGTKQYKRWMKRLSGINLSGAQQQQVQGLLSQYAQQHPAGSPRDPQGAHALRSQIFAILNPDQQTQLRAEIKAMKAQHGQRQVQQGQYQPYQQQPQPATPPVTR